MKNNIPLYVKIALGVLAVSFTFTSAFICIHVLFYEASFDSLNKSDYEIELLQFPKIQVKTESETRIMEIYDLEQYLLTNEI